MNIKAGTWFMTGNTDNHKLFQIIESKDGRYTIKEEMYYGLGTLYIANDNPNRKLSWSNESMGIRSADYNVREFIPLVFKADKTIKTDLNRE